MPTGVRVYQGKTTSSAKQIDTIATPVITPSSQSPSITWDELDTPPMNSLQCHQKHNSSRPNQRHGTNKLIFPKEMNLHRKGAHSQWAHHSIINCMASAPYGENYRLTYNGFTAQHQQHDTTTTPSIWFQEPTSTSLNIPIAMARHLANTRNRLTRKQQQTNWEQYIWQTIPFHTNSKESLAVCAV